MVSSKALHGAHPSSIVAPVPPQCRARRHVPRDDRKDLNEVPANMILPHPARRGPGRASGRAPRQQRAQHQVAHHGEHQGTGEDTDPVRDHVVVGARLEASEPRNRLMVKPMPQRIDMPHSPPQLTPSGLRARRCRPGTRHRRARRAACRRTARARCRASKLLGGDALQGYAGVGRDVRGGRDGRADADLCRVQPRLPFTAASA